MRPRRPIKATPEQVRISREGEDGIIDYADPRYGSMRLRIGPQVAVMTDAEILAMANDVIDAQNRMVAESEFRPVEIPSGRPQIRWLEDMQSWIARGQVLRCHLSDDEHRRLVVWIDDEELDADAFARLLVSYAGWGMRITFVDESEVNDAPEVIIRDPDDREL